MPYLKEVDLMLLKSHELPEDYKFISGNGLLFSLSIGHYFAQSTRACVCSLPRSSSLVFLEMSYIVVLFEYYQSHCRNP